jgi:hypothetical protein
MYPWPASAISESEMALLHRTREAWVPRVPITELIRRAVVETYGPNAERGSRPMPGDKPLQDAA